MSAPSLAPSTASLRSAQAPVPSGWTLVYDGDCNFCQRSVALIRRWDRRGALRCLPFQSDAELAALPAIPRSALEQAMHLVAPDGRVFAGAAAAPETLRLMPGGRPLAWLFGLPGVPFVARRVYQLVARNRHRLGCGSATCPLGR